MKLHNISNDFIASQGSDWKVDDVSGRVSVLAPDIATFLSTPAALVLWSRLPADTTLRR
jgi:hypothetical protein